MNQLFVEFAGEERNLNPGDELTFGRDADLDIDTNPYLHRRLGLFRHESGGWWIHNTGSAISLEICDIDSPSRLSIAPGTQSPLPFMHSVARFQAGSMVYELNIERPNVKSDHSMAGEADGSPTITASQVPLNDEQRLLLVALGQRRLRDRAAPRSALPTNREVADGLGWTITKFNRKLDNLCDKFRRLGVSGLKGDLGSLASNRRERLVDHAITVGLINRSDLSLLAEENSQ